MNDVCSRRVYLISLPFPITHFFSKQPYKQVPNSYWEPVSRHLVVPVYRKSFLVQMFQQKKNVRDRGSENEQERNKISITIHVAEIGFTEPAG